MRKIKGGEWTGLLPGLFAAGIGLLGVGLLLDSASVGQGIRDGLAACGNVLIPALFPFMVLAGFVSRTDYAGILSRPLTPLTTKVYKLPPALGSVVLLSMVGGYPVGARMVADLLEDGKINEQTAQRMLCFCFNCGPSFLISAVGAGMLMNPTAGIILLVTQITATILVGGAISRRTATLTALPGRRKNTPGASAFVAAVTGAASSMITMCAFAVLFSGVLALVKSSGLVAGAAAVLPVREEVIMAVASGFFEVTAGCLSAARVGGIAGFGLISAGVSFGGLSVIFQVMSCLDRWHIRFRPFIFARLAHMACAGAMALPLYHLLCKEQSAYVPIDPPVMHAGHNTWIISVCLLAMCSILVLSAENQHR